MSNSKFRDVLTLDRESPGYKGKDFSSDQDVRWCPGCGDYTILKQVQNSMPDLGVPKEQVVFISGIGCSSRFPYYMDTFGMHSIHGRAPAIATGLKINRPELSVWMITGDGDSLSIGGNHFIHLLRRNLDINVLLFNNEIYGLTKGQYSPTSKEGFVSKSTPMGSVDHPFNPVSLALGADATFVARAMDRDPKHLNQMIMRSKDHAGTSLLEIYQNCVVFNDGVFDAYTDKKSRPRETLYVSHGEPLVYGENKDRGIILDGYTPRMVDIGNNYSLDDLWIHDEKDLTKAQLLSRFFERPIEDGSHFPRVFGVFYAIDRPKYETGLNAQVEWATENNKKSLDDILRGDETWEIK